MRGGGGCIAACLPAVDPVPAGLQVEERPIAGVLGLGGEFARVAANLILGGFHLPLATTFVLRRSGVASIKKRTT
jgi:hypothetical protein